MSWCSSAAVRLNAATCCTLCNCTLPRQPDFRVHLFSGTVQTWVLTPPSRREPKQRWMVFVEILPHPQVSPGTFCLFKCFYYAASCSFSNSTYKKDEWRQIKWAFLNWTSPHMWLSSHPKLWVPNPQPPQVKVMSMNENSLDSPFSCLTSCQLDLLLAEQIGRSLPGSKPVHGAAGEATLIDLKGRDSGEVCSTCQLSTFDF